jgi:hypothetical protein
MPLKQKMSGKDESSHSNDGQSRDCDVLQMMYLAA